MAIAAGAVRYARLAAGIAGIDVAAELGGAAGCEAAQDALLGLRHPQARHATIGSGQRTDDVGHLEGWLVHWSLSAAVATIPAGSPTAVMSLRVTCVQITVLLIAACPSSAWTVRRSVPDSSRWVAKQWRKVCGDTGLPATTWRTAAMASATASLVTCRSGYCLLGNSQERGR